MTFLLFFCGKVANVKKKQYLCTFLAKCYDDFEKYTFIIIL